MKKIKIIQLLLFTGIVSGVFYACAKDEGPFVKKTIMVNVPNDSIPNDTIVITIPEPTVYTYSISFGTNVKPIFQASCIMGCHTTNHPYLDLRPPVAYNELLTTGASAPYVNVSMPKQSILYRHLVGIYTLMPKNGTKLPQGKIDTVYTWIAQGALNN